MAPKQSLAFGVLVVLVLSGCTRPESSADPTSGPTRGSALEADPVKGVMTSQTKTEKRVGPCTSPPTGIQVTPSQSRYCGYSYLWAEGDIDLVELPVHLRTLNGEVRLEFSNGPGWNLTIEAKTTNRASESEARQTIENLLIDWSHEEEGGHFLRVLARAKSTNCNNICPMITVVAKLPDNVFVRAALESTNGDAIAGGHQYPHLLVSTTNGDAILRDSITRDVVLRTTNGGVELRARPYGSGEWDLRTTNGRVTASIPEEPTIGYDLRASTTNGDVEVTLKDGQVRSATRTAASFRTADFESRDVQIDFEARNTNGDVEIGRL